MRSKMMMKLMWTVMLKPMACVIMAMNAEAVMVRLLIQEVFRVTILYKAKIVHICIYDDIGVDVKFIEMNAGEIVAGETRCMLLVGWGDQQFIWMGCSPRYRYYMTNVEDSEADVLGSMVMM